MIFNIDKINFEPDCLISPIATLELKTFVKKILTELNNEIESKKRFYSRWAVKVVYDDSSHELLPNNVVEYLKAILQSNYPEYKFEIRSEYGDKTSSIQLILFNLKLSK